MFLKEGLVQSIGYQGEILNLEQLREFQRQLAQRGREVLRESGALDFLENLRIAMRSGALDQPPKHIDADYPEERRRTKLARLNNHPQPGAESRFIDLAGGNVVVELGWGYEEVPSAFKGGCKKIIHESLRLTVQSASGGILVSGKLHELIAKGMWSNPETGRNTLEQAILRAYIKPGIQAEPTLF
ncbi:MAG: hypothetical protein HY426_02940 [Candidatus Levybacteria bacterium]|nr:hypothetical protein [Candidatus Levybacteria bacterium]